MNAENNLAALAAAIAEPARAKMLCCLMDGRARTSTELAIVAQVGASTASVHLAKLHAQFLVTVVAQGKHRYYQLTGTEVAGALEALLHIAGGRQTKFVPSTPERLRDARTCYDHLAGTVGVGVHDSMLAQGWLRPGAPNEYALSEAGSAALEAIGVDIAAARIARRRFACACLDWSERRAHLGGALGAALLTRLLQRNWLDRDLDSRALTLTSEGRKGILKIFPGVAQVGWKP